MGAPLCYVCGRTSARKTRFANAPFRTLRSGTMIKNFVTVRQKTILSQYPKAKTEVSSQSRVFVQTDGLNITMPSMEGWSRKEVEAFASMANLKVTFEGVGTVYSQNISKGTALKSGQEVKVKAK